MWVVLLSFVFAILDIEGFSTVEKGWESRCPTVTTSYIQQELYRRGQQLRGIFRLCPLPCHRPALEDRVRELCVQVAAAKTEAEVNVILPQLQAAIHDSAES